MKYERFAYTYYHGGSTPAYLAQNLYNKTEKFGNLYLIWLNPTLLGTREYDDFVAKLLSCG